jgi:hypothetical protein
MNAILAETVRLALKGLLIPPLQDLVIEYLPKRALLTSPRLLDLIEWQPLVFVSHHYNSQTDTYCTWILTSRKQYQAYVSLIPVRPFSQRLFDFRPFLSRLGAIRQGKGPDYYYTAILTCDEGVESDVVDLF